MTGTVPKAAHVYIRSDITKNDIGAGLETVWAELYLPKTKPILVGLSFFVPPKQMDFFSLLEQSCLNCNNFTNSECIILGDFNQLHVSLKHFMSMFDLSQLISNPTRITSTTSTILDLISVSDPIKINKCGVSDLGVGDHLLIYCTRKCKKVPVNDGVKLRSLKNYPKEAFEGKLQQVDWQEVTSCDTVHQAWYNFTCKFLAVIDDIAPTRYVRVKQRTDPWMTEEILHLIYERDRAFTKFKKSEDHSWQEKLIYLRNQVQSKKKTS